MARMIKAAAAAIVAGTSAFAVVRWLRSRPRQDDRMRLPREHDEIVDEADLESFPASDPPAWTLGADPAPSGTLERSGQSELLQP